MSWETERWHSLLYLNVGWLFLFICLKLLEKEVTSLLSVKFDWDNNVLKNYSKPWKEWAKTSCGASGSWGSAISDQEVFCTIITADHNSTSMWFSGQLKQFLWRCFFFFEVFWSSMLSSWSLATFSQQCCFNDLLAVENFYLPWNHHLIKAEAEIKFIMKKCS